MVQVEADGWLDAEIEPMLAGLVRACEAARVPLALAVSVDSCFVIRRNPASAQFEIDEIETSEMMSPHPLHPDGARLTEAVLRWCEQAAKGEAHFLAMAQLPRRISELGAIMRGVELKTRPGAAEPLRTLEG